MVKSYRGKEVDIVSLAKKNEKTVALGNAHMNGRGGKIVETREEMLEKYYNANTIQQATVNMKDNIEENAKIEDELKDMTVESLIKNQTIKVAKPSKKKIEATDENEIKEEN